MSKSKGLKSWPSKGPPSGKCCKTERQMKGSIPAGKLLLSIHKRVDYVSHIDLPFSRFHNRNGISTESRPGKFSKQYRRNKRLLGMFK